MKKKKIEMYIFFLVIDKPKEKQSKNLNKNEIEIIVWIRIIYSIYSGFRRWYYNDKSYQQNLK